MKSLREYIELTEEHMQSPDTGDQFAFELDDGTLLETYVMERNAVGDILLDSTEEIFNLLEDWNLLSEDDQENPVVDAITKRILNQRLDLLAKYGPEYIMQAIEDVADFVDIDTTEEIGTSDISGWVKQVEWNLANKLNQYDEPMEVGDALDESVGSLEQLLANYAQEVEHFKQDGDLDDDLYHALFDYYVNSGEMPYGTVKARTGDPYEWITQRLDSELSINEAEYQGRKVPLNKPMRGDVKKFKVYVRNPKTGNVKKVNFGHGGTSARRAGQKTMRIRKSDPDRRRSFRARHRCDNPGPKTGARYWSCRKW